MLPIAPDVLPATHPVAACICPATHHRPSVTANLHDTRYVTYALPSCSRLVTHTQHAQCPTNLCTRGPPSMRVRHCFDAPTVHAHARLVEPSHVLSAPAMPDAGCRPGLVPCTTRRGWVPGMWDSPGTHYVCHYTLLGPWDSFKALFLTRNECSCAPGNA